MHRKNFNPLIIFILIVFGFFTTAFASNYQPVTITKETKKEIKQQHDAKYRLLAERHEEEPTQKENHQHQSADNEHGEHSEHDEAHGEEGHEGDHHGPDTAPLFFIMIAIVIGAATRHFLKALPFPFTVLLLIIGIILGVLTRVGAFEHWGSIDVSFIANSLTWAAHMDPHLLLFVFLPILIFEAAFAMDLHTFKKSATNSIILAVPGIIVALLLTGVLVYAIDWLDLGLPGWANWSLAFCFGSVISATDPVAVVALLKELGASKKLGTLIEGESLLNDGTAIVFFMALAPLLAIVDPPMLDQPVAEFARVALGGVVVGSVIGWIVLRWVKKVFNDAMVEISVVVAAAYLTFYIAEHFLHVSGVLALVALGLIVGGFGRSSISPQVEHFMHEFWELAGFFANSMIFLIVGLVIAERTNFTANDFLSLIIVYIGIHVVRGIVIIMLYPFMRKAGYGLPPKDAIVVWYGALRGAIGLALALIVAGADTNAMANAMEISPEEAQNIKDQFLFLIAGTVLLSLLVNATTIKILINKLGLTKLEPAKAKMIYNASTYLRNSVDNQMKRIQSDRYLKKADWDKVSEFLPSTIEISEEDKYAQIETVAETRRRILEKEKSSYWHQFKDGLLGADAVRGLSDGIDELLDAGGKIPLSERADLEESWDAPKWLVKLKDIPLIKIWAENALLNRLTKSYDSAVGFITAQEECMSLLESIARSGEVEAQDLDMIEAEINENKIHGQSFIRNLRKNYRDIYNAISTRQAIRTVLNYEKSQIDRLQKKGRIDGGEADKMQVSLLERTKRLIDSPPEVEHAKKAAKTED